MSAVVTVDPATGKPLAQYAVFSDADVDAALDRAAQVRVGRAARSSEDRAANDTRFGLGAGVWTGDPQRGIAVARRIRSGAAFVDAVVASDVRMPFGGTRASGYGRELAAAGIRGVVDVRTWWVLDAPAATAPASEWAA
jgi:acyl-CoA reductase-like NAD-dependent aldehyde dehydrogenase